MGRKRVQLFLSTVQILPDGSFRKLFFPLRRIMYQCLKHTDIPLFLLAEMKGDFSQVPVLT